MKVKFLLSFQLYLKSCAGKTAIRAARMKQTRVEITRVCESCEHVDSRVIITFSTLKHMRYHVFVKL